MIGVTGIIKTIAVIFLSFFLQQGVSGAIDDDPYDAAGDFMKGITQHQEKTIGMYMDNEYVNFITNVQGEKDTTDRMREYLTKNLSYEFGDIEQRGNLAVIRMKIKGNDFSGVLEGYEKASYDYVTGNLYDDEITDKNALSEKCLEIYVDQIEKEATEGKLHEDIVYLPLTQDKHGNWRILLSDEIMQQILGNIALPEGTVKTQDKTGKKDDAATDQEEKE